MFCITPFDGLLIYKPKVFTDIRGRFYESYNQNTFKDAGIQQNFIQDNFSSSTRNTLRGLHFQIGEFAQAKLVTVLRGHVFDVVVDLREGSQTFGQWYGIHLNHQEPQSLLIPRGFAHGFVVLSESADFLYKVDNVYNKESERGIYFADKDLNINWPVNIEETILSDKDQKLPSFQQYKIDAL